MRILYVEDAIQDSDLARRHLARHAPDIHMEVAPTLAEARDRLAQDATYDLVLADLRLPDGSGLDLLGEIREQALPVAVVILTGSGDETAAVTALKAGADDYLAKHQDYLARLPLVLETALARFRAEASRRVRVLQVLYAEHNIADIDLTRRHLARHAPHIHLEAVNTAYETLRRLPPDQESYPCDVLLLDYHLPGTNALELLRTLRQERALDLPVVFVTGHGDEEVATEAWRLGATDYLVKNAGYLFKLPIILENAFHRTQLAREQAALRQSEQELIRAQHIGRLGNWNWDIAKSSLVWSDELYRLFGVEKEHFALTFENIENRIHPDDRALNSAMVAQLLGSALQVSWELRIIQPDGAVRWIHQNVEIARNSSGQPIRAFGTMQDITERKEVEESLAAERHLLRTLIDNLPDRIYAKDTLGRFTIKNLVDTRLMGAASTDEIVGKTDCDYYPPELAAQFQADDQAVLRSGQPLINREEPFTAADGTQGWMLTSKVPLRDDQGNVIGLVGIGRDITERKCLEDKERDARALAEALAETASALTRALDLDDVMNAILDNVARVVPHDAANIMLIESDQARIAYWHGYQPESLPFLQGLQIPLVGTTHLQYMLANRSPFLAAYTDQHDSWVRRPHTEWVKSYVAAPIQSHDVVIGFLNVDSGTPGFFAEAHAQRLQVFADQASLAIERAQLYEETRRHAVELEQRVLERTAQLNHAKERIEAILNSSNDVMILCRTNGLIDQVNPVFDKVFGCAPNPDEVYSQPLSALVIPEHAPLLEQVLELVARTRQPKRLEVRARYKEHPPFDGEMMLSPVVGRDKHLFGIICSLRDITERKKMETQLRQMLEHEMALGELKSRYVSMAAHDLRNPLATVQAAVDVLDKYHQRLTEEQRQAKYSSIQHGIRVMVDLLNDILLIGQAESGKLKFEPRPLDLVAFCQNLVAELHQTIDVTERITFLHQDVRDTVSMDTKLLRHILGNLLSNALKYSPADSAVVFDMRDEPNAVTLRIEDHGIGIPQTDQERLFEPFHRAGNVGSTPGTGLGLAIVRQSVDLHGGTISFDSEEGIGTTFTVVLPKTPAAD